MLLVALTTHANSGLGAGGNENKDCRTRDSFSGASCSCVCTFLSHVLQHRCPFVANAVLKGARRFSDALRDRNYDAAHIVHKLSVRSRKLRSPATPVLSAPCKRLDSQIDPVLISFFDSLGILCQLRPDGLQRRVLSNLLKPRSPCQCAKQVSY